MPEITTIPLVAAAAAAAAACGGGGCGNYDESGNGTGGGSGGGDDDDGGDDNDDDDEEDDDYPSIASSFSPASAPCPLALLLLPRSNVHESSYFFFSNLPRSTGSLW